MWRVEVDRKHFTSSGRSRNCSQQGSPSGLRHLLGNMSVFCYSCNCCFHFVRSGNALRRLSWCGCADGIELNWEALSLEPVLIAASQPALLWPPGNRKDLHHLSCCQRTLWVSQLVMWCVRACPPLSLLFSWCCRFLTSALPPLQPGAVQAEGAGAQRVRRERNSGRQREGQKLRSAHCGRDAPRVSPTFRQTFHTSWKMFIRLVFWAWKIREADFSEFMVVDNRWARSSFELEVTYSWQMWFKEAPKKHVSVVLHTQSSCWNNRCN